MWNNWARFFLLYNDLKAINQNHNFQPYFNQDTPPTSKMSKPNFIKWYCDSVRDTQMLLEEDITVLKNIDDHPKRSTILI